VGSINFASLFATGENYVIRKVKGGIKRLGDILSRGVGMNDMHTICLYSLLGNSTFTIMMKSVFNLELDGLVVGDILVRLKREHQRRKHQRKVVDRIELENRVSNGDKLDTADEAKLSKLSAAHESKKKRDRERMQRKKLKTVVQ
jgi:hypothetical protein